MLFNIEMDNRKAKKLWETLRILPFERQPKIMQMVLIQIVERLDPIINYIKKDEVN